MKTWVGAELSPVIAQWITSTYGVETAAVRTLRLRDARDRDIFMSAREANAIIMTKDRDLVDLAIQLGSPPQILWLTCGNTSNTTLKALLTNAWPLAVDLLNAGETVVEVSDKTS